MKPVVLVPGVGGSILVDKTKPYRKIMRQRMIHNRWLNVYPFIPRSIDEWKYDMRCDVMYDARGKVVGVKSNSPSIEAFDFGGTRGLKDVLPEFLLLPTSMQDAMQTSFHFRYFNDLCNIFYAFGFEDHKTLIGMPYDFRLVLDPEYRSNLFLRMKECIEDAEKRTCKRVVVATHSLGCLMFKWFLSSYVDEDWISKHVDSIFMLSPPFGGSLYSLKTVLVGDFYIPQFHNMYKDELQTNTGVIMCLPNRLRFEDTQELIRIEHPEPHAISLSNYKDLYDQDHVSFKIWYDLYEQHMGDVCKPISVKCHIINGINKATPNMYKQRTTFSYPHKEFHDKGDGIIFPLKEHEFRRIFTGDQVEVTNLPNSKHTDIISDKYVISKILESSLSHDK